MFLSPNDERWVDETWHRCVARLERSSARIKDGFPHVSRGGRYENASLEAWTNGFWPGLLWLAYRENGDARLRNHAESCEAKLDELLHEFVRLHHDVGFMWLLSSVANFKVTGSARSRQRGLLAASILASRYNLKGRFIRAWNWDEMGVAIIDCMMNLPLLYWASEQLGDPRFRHIAMAHSDTAIEHFVRPDGSCRHVVSFDAETGAFLDVLNGQGHSPDSAWARGAAWGVYGFALAARSTGEARYLATSSRVADFFLSQLPPDGVPYWDFSVPVTPTTPRDSSAGAIAAGGLLELAAQLPEPRAGHYRSAALGILRGLDAVCSAWDEDEEAILRKATGFLPRGQNIEVPLIYGDFFFVEALAKLRGQSTMLLG